MPETYNHYYSAIRFMYKRILKLYWDEEEISCMKRDRALPTEKWMDAQREDVLEAPYFHVVFTVPQELNPLIFYNQEILALGSHDKRMNRLLLRLSCEDWHITSISYSFHACGIQVKSL